MAVNPYTLNNLYAQGIIDYVPTELALPTPVGAMQSMNNPYLNMAKQGGLYQQYGNGDSFAYSQNGINSSVNIPNGNSKIGSHSFLGGLNIFGDRTIGGNNSQGIAGMHGDQSIGYDSSIGLGGAYGANGIGYDNQGGLESMYGGFVDTKQGISNGIGRVQAIYNGTPTIIKGLAAAAIIAGTLMHIFKGGKKPSAKESKGLLSKLNPLNWFKKSKPEPVKQSFWSKINIFKKK